MRILSIGNFGTSWDGSICDEEHIARALERLGHEVTRWQREEVGEARNSHLLDFVLVAQWDGYHPEVIANLKAYNSVPVVYWAFDYQADGQGWHERLIEGADLYLSKRIADSKYPNWQWLPQDFAPELLASNYRPAVPTDQKDIDVLFTGSYLPWATERTELLKAVAEEFDLTVHSFTPDEWKAQGLTVVNGPVMDTGLIELVGRAKVNLSIDHTIEAGYWSDRNAQTMACGGFVLSRYVPMMETVFRDKIAYFYNTKDCLRQVRKYLDDDFQREHIAAVGQGYAQHNLMVADRVKDLLIIVQNKL